MAEAVCPVALSPIRCVAETRTGSVGMYALQLAHVAGYKVVTVASLKNHALCKSFGADFVFDVRMNMSAPTSYVELTPRLTSVQ